MILSNRSIEEAIKEGRLVVTPTPQPMPSDPAFDDNSPYKTSALELRLGQTIAWIDSNDGLQVNLSKTNFKTFFEKMATTHDLVKDGPFKLSPGTFVLAKTRETVSLPIQSSESRSLAARVEGKSSYARCGVLVHFTAPTIHSNFEGTITLEIKNLGPLTVELEYEIPICQLIIEEVKGRPKPRDSQFQNQQAPSGAQPRPTK